MPVSQEEKEKQREIQTTQVPSVIQVKIMKKIVKTEEKEKQTKTESFYYRIGRAESIRAVKAIILVH